MRCTPYRSQELDEALQIVTPTKPTSAILEAPQDGSGFLLMWSMRVRGLPENAYDPNFLDSLSDGQKDICMQQPQSLEIDTEYVRYVLSLGGRSGPHPAVRFAHFSLPANSESRLKRGFDMAEIDQVSKSPRSASTTL